MPGPFSGSGDIVVDKRPALMELAFYEGRPTTRERKKNTIYSSQKRKVFWRKMQAGEGKGSVGAGGQEY